MPEHAAAAYSLSYCTVSVNVGVDGAVIISLGSSRMFYSADDGAGPRQPAAHHYGDRTCGAPSRRVSGLKLRNKNTCGSLWLRETGTKSVGILHIITVPVIFQ